eukprot:gene4853-5490_t
MFFNGRQPRNKHKQLQFGSATLLPDKYKIMSPANKVSRDNIDERIDTTMDHRGLRKFSVEDLSNLKDQNGNLQDDDSRLKVEDNADEFVGLNFHERLSRLVLVTARKDKKATVSSDAVSRQLFNKSNRSADYRDEILELQRSIVRIRDLRRRPRSSETAAITKERLQPSCVVGDQQIATRPKADYFEDVDAVQTKDLNPPKRPGSPEKKCVRFVDEVTTDDDSDCSGSMNNRLDLLIKNGKIGHDISDGSGGSRVEERNKDMSAATGTDQNESNHSNTIERRRNNVITSRNAPRNGILRKTRSSCDENLRQDLSFDAIATNDYRCQECDKTFKYRSNLKTHVLTVHSGATYRQNGTVFLPNSTDDFFVCDVCSRFFKYSVNLRAHKIGHTRSNSKLSSTI